MLRKKTFKYLLLLITGAQIVLGLLWMAGNFGRLPQFSLTEELVEISRTWVLDEYTGGVYPALIAGSRALERWFHVPFFIWLYLLQLLLAFASGTFLLSSLWGQKLRRFENVWGSLYLMTIPMTAQLHLSVLPYSLSLSLFFFLTGILKRMTEENGDEAKGRKRLFKPAALTAAWIMLILLLPETFFMTAVLGITAAGIALVRKKKRCAQALATVLVLSLGIGGAANAMVQQPGSRGQIQKSIGSVLLSRVVWPYFDMDYYFWPPEIKEVMSEDMAWTVSCNAERVKDLFGPAVEEAYGRKKAEELYLQMAKAGFTVRTKDVVKQIAADLGFYACPQVGVNLQLDGVGNGLNAYNYNQMKEARPLLTKYYVNYSLNSFGIVMLLGIAGWIYLKCRKKIQGRGLHISSVLLLGLPAVWQALYAALFCAGMTEYKNAWFVTAVYGIWILFWIRRLEDTKKGDYNGQDCSIDTVL